MLENAYFDTAGTLEWLEQLCTEAVTLAAEDDPALFDAIAKTPELADFFGIWADGTMTAEEWAQNRPPYFVFAAALKQECENATRKEVVRGLDGIAGKLKSGSLSHQRSKLNAGN